MYSRTHAHTHTHARTHKRVRTLACDCPVIWRVRVTDSCKYYINLLPSGVTESLFLGGQRGGGADLHRGGGGGGQEDGIAMKGAQSNVKCGGQWGEPCCEWGGGMAPPGPPPHSYATAAIFK